MGRGDGACERTMKGHTVEWGMSAAFNADGLKIVSASEDMTMRVWDAASGACEQTMKVHVGRVNSAGFSPDGREIVSTGGDMTMRIWDLAIGDCRRTIHQLGVVGGIQPRWSVYRVRERRG